MKHPLSIALIAFSFLLNACGGGSSGSTNPPPPPPPPPAVSDNVPPVIDLLGANPQTVEAGESYIEHGASAMDNVDGDLTNSIVIDVLKFSSLNLADNGKIFFKFFNGLESETIIKYVKKNFSTHKILKPDSSRKASKEVYMLCSC